MILFIAIFAIALAVTFFMAKAVVKILNNLEVSKKRWFKITITIIFFILNYYILLGGLILLTTVYPEAEEILNQVNFSQLMLAILIAIVVGTFETYKGLGKA
ncbi:hypothetical protein [Acinetobacter baumannii]|uniref:hypothetical protein n=1 Tax=Acinetobacter baumannii TaxID=470 RepID=UPI000FBEF1E5|nr:hypothetical protein [Acinetobacter baumannii]EHU1360675.1 hypothetical protein [Acinetobacter baumannii]MDC5611683.1 hypothetical protein [Acinetobacter baumannii]RUT37143.1 hypothetical protein EM030_18555 [Acinetobacter baumannii]